MRRITSKGNRVAVLLAGVIAIGAIATYIVATASAEGRTINAQFCIPGESGVPNPPGNQLYCMMAALDGQTVLGYAVNANGGTCGLTMASMQYCAPSGTGFLNIRPGTYWLAVTDNHNSHNFELRSCPDSTTACMDGDGPETQLTPICNTNGGDTPCGGATGQVISNTVKINLKHGWYRLFCDTTGHEMAGMYIDIEVGGVGQSG